MQATRWQRLLGSSRATSVAIAGPIGHTLRLFKGSAWTAATAEFLLHLEHVGVAPGTAAFDRAIAAHEEGWWGPHEEPADEPPDEGRIEW